VIIRHERPEDHEALGALTFSLVAEQDGVLVGQIAVSPAVSSAGGDWYALGPVAVLRRQDSRATTSW
jgi:predicted N-acetyltransferase YhbS